VKQALFFMLILLPVSPREMVSEGTDGRIER
jgi:hypothetical protein